VRAWWSPSSPRSLLPPSMTRRLIGTGSDTFADGRLGGRLGGLRLGAFNPAAAGAAQAHLDGALSAAVDRADRVALLRQWRLGYRIRAAASW
jgi:hypothetical protein